MSNRIIVKSSNTAGAEPLPADLVEGELAINFADKKIFSKDSTGAIVEFCAAAAAPPVQPPPANETIWEPADVTGKVAQFDVVIAYNTGTGELDLCFDNPGGQGQNISINVEIEINNVPIVIPAFGLQSWMSGGFHMAQHMRNHLNGRQSAGNTLTLDARYPGSGACMYLKSTTGDPLTLVKFSW